MKVLVVIETAHGKITGQTKETLTVAQDVDATIEGVILGHEIGDLAQEAIGYGVSKVYKVDDPQLKGVNLLYHIRTIQELIKTAEPQIIMAAATLYGQEMMPRLAARHGQALLASVKTIEVDDDEVEGIHPIFEEKLLAKYEADIDPYAFATILPGNNPECEVLPDASAAGAVEDFAVVIADEDKREEFVNEEMATVSVDITKAKLLVSGGRGVGSKDNFSVIYDTAKALGGEAAASRAAVDANFCPYDYEVGQTGKTVTPDFYIACGISGAIQHLVGMRNSKTIIAVNTDEEAPILDVAHFAIIGDLHAVLPEIVKKIE